MVNHLNRNSAGLRLAKRSRDITVQSFPCFPIYLGLQSDLQRFVWICGSKEVGMAHEEGFFVVVGVDKPAGNTVGGVADDLASLGFEHIHAVNLDLDLVVASIQNIDIGLAKNDEQIAFTCVLEVVGHVQVGVHSGLEYWDSTKLVELT